MAFSSCLPDGWACIFDLDGVIIHSMPWHLEAWDQYLISVGKGRDHLPERLHGRRNDEIVPELIGAELSPEEIEFHGAQKECLFRDLIGPHVQKSLVPGVREFLSACEGTPLAVASNAERANVKFLLEESGLKGCFQVIVDGGQVKRAKPAPDIYLKAAEALGVPPARCVVFEDSEAGVRAGIACGARVVGVRTTVAELEDVDLHIDDFDDRALYTWLKALHS